MVENEQNENISNSVEIPVYSHFWYDNDLRFKGVIVTAEVADNSIVTALHVLIDIDEITIKKVLLKEDVNNLFKNVKTYSDFKKALCSLIDDF